jgi:hypothetical protein
MHLRIVHVAHEILPHLLDACHHLIKIELLLSFLNKEILRQPIIYDIIVQGLIGSRVQI